MTAKSGNRGHLGRSWEDNRWWQQFFNSGNTNADSILVRGDSVRNSQLILQGSIPVGNCSANWNWVSFIMNTPHHNFFLAKTLFCPNFRPKKVFQTISFQSELFAAKTLIGKNIFAKAFFGPKLFLANTFLANFCLGNNVFRANSCLTNIRPIYEFPSSSQSPNPQSQVPCQSISSGRQVY